MRLIRELLQETRAVTMGEYVVLLALIALASVGGVTKMRSLFVTSFNATEVVTESAVR